MTKSIRKALIVAACAFVTACASKPQPPPAPAPVFKSNEMDGTYHGTSTRYQADLRTCPSPGLVTLRVRDAIFSYRWNRDNFVVATVAPDGSVSGQNGEINLSGTATDGRIEGDISNASCGYHFTTTKRPR